MSGLRFRILGPLEIEGAAGPGVSYTPGAAKVRGVLGALLVNANGTVSVDSLIDELWQDDPPRTATTTLQVYVSQLRKIFRRAAPENGAPVLLTQPRGYRIRIDADQLDLTTFEGLYQRGREALEAGDHAAAAELQGRALALWRGPLLGDTPHGPLLDAASVRLLEARTAALEQRILADLQLGRHRDLIPELRSLVEEFPLREELHGQLMLALYRAGRQAEALRAYGALRRTLVNELAIEPGAPVQLLHQRILAGDRQLATPEPIGSPALALGSAAEPPVVHGLPPADPAFTGREDELAEIDRLLRAAPPGAFVALAGQPGVGKTALAVAAAHHSADAFPHGQLFLDLRPEPGRRLEPAAAISALLRRAGAPVPAGGDPADLHEALQQLLAGRRLLLVLDNVSSEAQLRPLLPTSAGSSAIVTGRRLPAGLDGVRPLVLDVLGPRAALAVFEAAAGPARAAEHPAAVAELLELCGGLPLAIRVGTAQLNARPHWSAESLAGRLRDRRSRLSELRIGGLDVRERLLSAYQDAGRTEQRTFRLLALLPDHFEPWAVSAVLGLDPHDRRTPVGTARLLDALADDHLLTADHDGPQPGRYRLPELLRLLAAERLAEEEGEDTVRAATRRLCDAYVRVAEEADAVLNPRQAGVRMARDNGGDAPSEWFARELGPLTQVVRQAYLAGLWEQTVRLTTALTGHLESHARWRAWEQTHTLALDAARQLGDRSGEARLLGSLGDLAWQHRRTAEARDRYEAARRVAEDCGDQVARSRALVGLADLWLDGGEVPEAAALLTAALAALPPGRPRERYHVLRAMALTALLAEGPTAARSRFTECLEIAQTLRDRRLEAHARRALRRLHDPDDDPAGCLEIRPGVWRLRSPAPLTPALV
ncbi:DNA-binding SARP family transcriptional activator [Kitasatospora gansuensis]|uniref:DNA-binding SARP family transcriptional activator n=1 Tax=Kitasatospora gansuensis TaxID=258050 RepID=A0A7W7SA30_9ACTN|nr:BTAD domain-containing putative transcriptional regulator [Kitasatospora gansuensis]MBB4946073.1 DNA-binding SARP family transcriptional activator [Kitasatospora gansuensis]